MIDNTQEYILCAAYKRVKPRKCIHNAQPYHPGTNDICNIEIGYRHHDIIQRFPSRYIWVYNLLHYLHLYKWSARWYTNHSILDLKSDGFYTSKGRWVDRYDGMKIAFAAGQVSKEKAFVPDFTEEDARIFGIDGDKDYWRKKHDGYAPLFSEDLY